jgi:transcriptional regulator with XRE-family HTH domain
MPTTFGKFISAARKKAGLTQRALASKLKRDDGESISFQYLNDIELDRRSPPGPWLLAQISEILKIPMDVLYYRARVFPDDLLLTDADDATIKRAFREFRRALK